MKSRYSLFIAAFLVTFVSFAQPSGYYEQALIFGQTNAFGSTARIQGIGGAQVSLGGDVSSAGSNPAGLGFFNRSVFSFTPSVTFHDTEGIYVGGLERAFQPNVNLPNMGVVLNHTIGDIPQNKFKGGSFAISVTRINDFNQKFFYQGYSPDASILDSFLNNAGTTEPNKLPELEWAAFNTFLIDTVDNGSDPSIAYRVLGGTEPFLSESVITSGGQNQINFAWGGNYNDQFYFGAGLGIQTLDYERRRFYEENDFIGDGFDLESLTISDELRINGTGINGSFGVIVRPVNFVTVGISYVTPTYFSLREEYGLVVESFWNGFDDENYISDIITGEYNLRTPGRLNVGASAFLGKLGFISGDVEFVDHGATLLQSRDLELDLQADNQEIVNQYSSVINYRIGAELRLEDFRFRGGFAYMDDPYRTTDFDRSRNNITFGLGFRQKDFFVDLSVVRTSFNQYYSPFEISSDIGTQPVVQVNNANTSISTTVGFNF
ncbi:MAG: hypothetical protein JXR03_15315 [Cyclobacteriaceae bacterium]